MTAQIADVWVLKGKETTEIFANIVEPGERSVRKPLDSVPANKCFLSTYLPHITHIP